MVGDGIERLVNSGYLKRGGVHEVRAGIAERLDEVVGIRQDVDRAGKLQAAQRGVAIGGRERALLDELAEAPADRLADGAGPSRGMTAHGCARRCGRRLPIAS